MTEKVELVDTTLRDGHQSLWAERMTTGMMLPIAERLDAAGFGAIEVLSPSHLGKAVRDLKEDPFERISRLRERIGNTPMRLNAGGLNIFGFDQPCMFRLFWELMHKHGITEARISDPWNDERTWKTRVELLRGIGIRPIVNITFSISPRHTDEHYAQKTRAAAALSPYRICLKDPGGLLTPDRVRTLVPRMMAESGGILIEFHSHCSTGLGPLCALEAVQLGIRSVNVAIPPLADDASLPSVFNVARNLRTLGYDVPVDDDSLRPIERHFTTIAQREGFPIGRPVEYDTAQYVHQVPGGMISNLAHQLREVGAEARLPQTLEETVKVREEFGFPIMVTPLSQFVGSQAAINVIAGERYKQVTDQVIRYALGEFGGDVATAMDANVRNRILDRPRARELAKVERPIRSLDEMRQDIGEPGLSDEDLLLRFLARKEDIAAMRATGPAREYVTDADPMLDLVASLARIRDTDVIQVSRPGFRLTLRRGASPA